MKSLNQIMIEVGSGSIDALELLVKLADQYPQVILDVINVRGPAFEARIKELSRTEGRVAAVRFYRESIKGSSLKEAVEEVNRITGYVAS
jgi:hypothetical protein